MREIDNLEPRMDTKKHESDFLEKLLDGAEVEWMPLGEVTLPTSNIKWKETDRAYRYIDLTSVDRQTNTITEALEISKANAPSRAQKLVEKDDVIFATTRPTQMRYCLIDDEFAGEVASTGYCVLRAQQNAVLSKWILHWVSSCDFKIYLEEQQSGSAYPAISDAKVKAFQIPIPCPNDPEKSLAIQAEIVRILDTFSELTTELTTELTARKKQYIHYRDQLLTFEEGEVEWKTLGEISSIYDSLHQTPKYSEYGLSMIRVTDIKGGFVNLNETLKVTEEVFATFTKKYSPRRNDLVMSRVGSYGNVGIIPQDNTACMGQNTVVIRPHINNKYLFYILVSDIGQSFIEKNVDGGNQKTLSLKSIKAIPIPILPLAEQSRIVAILDKFDTLTHSISEGLPREIELRQQQYEYYRDMLLNFPKPEEKGTTDGHR